MGKYIVNNNIHGFEKLGIDEIKTVKDGNNEIFITLSKSDDTRVSALYAFVKASIKMHNRVFIISLRDSNASFKPLAALMTTYNAYDIYEVDDKTSISADYLNRITNRKPDYAEVQQYIGGDVTAYADMSTIMFGIQNLTAEGNVEGLKKFLEEHINSIERLSFTIDNMKKTCDMFNSAELITEINRHKEIENLLREDIKDRENRIEAVKEDRDRYKAQVANSEIEANKQREIIESLKGKVQSGGSVINNYGELNTSSIKCTAKVILYFKEVSYVKYTNSMITKFLNMFSEKDRKVKLIIYDNTGEFNQVYTPLTVVRGSEYIAMKKSLIDISTSFVAAEPIPAILSDILTSENKFDIVMIYDRMKCVTDLVSGNNVTKFYIINSVNDYKKAKQILKIKDSSCVITNSNSRMIGGVDPLDESQNMQAMDIKEIDLYDKQTETKQKALYRRMKATFYDKPLFDLIKEKAKVDKFLAV